jgi:hypothetical protein
MLRLLSFLILVIDILVVIDVVRSRKDSEKKILWVIAVVFLPVLGPILWYVWGSRS